MHKILATVTSNGVDRRKTGQNDPNEYYNNIFSENANLYLYYAWTPRFHRSLGGVTIDNTQIFLHEFSAVIFSVAAIERKNGSDHGKDNFNYMN